MLMYKKIYNILFKTITTLSVCLFCANTILLADSSTLTPLVGNPKVYQDMRKMMEERLVAHKDPLDESVKLEELRNPTSAVASTAETRTAELESINDPR